MIKTQLIDYLNWVKKGKYLGVKQRENVLDGIFSWRF